MEPQHLIGQPMHTDDYVGLFWQPAPLRDSLTVTGENDCFGVWWNVPRDLPSTPSYSNISVTNSPESAPVDRLDMIWARFT